MFEQCLLHNPVKDFSDSADRFHTVYIFIYLIITKKDLCQNQSREIRYPDKNKRPYRG